MSLDNLDQHDDRPGASTRLPFEDDNGDRCSARRCADEREALDRRRLDADGGSFVGQEAVTLSTTPVYVDGKLSRGR